MSGFIVKCNRVELTVKVLVDVANGEIEVGNDFEASIQEMTKSLLGEELIHNEQCFIDSIILEDSKIIEES